MNDSDVWRLRHMQDAAHDAVSFIQGETRETLTHDPRLAPAIVAKIMIIGEAASRVSLETQAAQPNIAWANIIGMRHILIHDYFKMDLDIVWDVVSVDLPELIVQLKAILPPEVDPGD